MAYEWERKWTPADADRLFTKDGTVKLPKAVGLAVGLAASEKSHGCLTRQPTRERAEAVMEAVRPLVEDRGLSMEIRPGSRTETFGLYVVRPVAA